MERRRKMDAARPAAGGCSLTRFASILVLFLGCVGFALAQAPPRDADLVRQAQQLLAEKRWQQIVDLVHPLPAPSAELDFCYGTALARLGRWDEAHMAFAAGHRLQPRDQRFLTELAGVAFKQKRYGEAATDLRWALQLAPQDAYANDFLGTVYFLQGNLDGALKYWNRVGKPQIASVRSEPVPRLDPALLDQAFAFSPASTLRLPDLWTTEARLRGLNVFTSFQFDLLAQPDGQFDAIFHNHQHSRWKDSKWKNLLLLFRGLPAQTVYPEVFNLENRGINLTSLYRWEAQKRRISVYLTGPFEGNPKHELAFSADLRSENWDLRDSFQGPAPLLGSLNLRREAVNFAFTSFTSGRWNWSAGAEVSHRDFLKVIPGGALDPGMLLKGYQLKQTAELNADLWRVPERRMIVSSTVSSEAGRIWSQPSHPFEKLQGTLRFHWFPRPEGDDYEMLHQLKLGKTWGDVPFDELYMLGVLGDNDLWMRAHIATRDGKKGSAPLGRSYFLSNWEIDKTLHRTGFYELKASPFVDTGKITDPFSGLGSHKWLWDLGLQLKVRALGAEAELGYGRDLRSGNNAVFVTLR
jgi:tetratricopeptide (TPR) repeat protein